MRQKVKVKERIEDKETKENKIGGGQGSHYWIIEMANGPSSRGICKYCGETREFLNTFPDFTVPKRKNKSVNIDETSDNDADEDEDFES